MATTTTIEMTGERLKAMDDNGMKLYCTPGSSQPYWNWQASFTYDECVATVEDFLAEAGYDELDESLFEEIFTLDVALVEAR